MKHRYFASSLALFLLGGCMHLESSHYLTGPPAAPVSSAPAIVLEGAEAPDHLRELGVLQAQCQGRACDMPKVLERLREEAAAIGATHVIHVRIDQGATMLVAHGVAATPGGWATGAPPSASASTPVPAPTP